MPNHLNLYLFNVLCFQRSKWSVRGKHESTRTIPLHKSMGELRERYINICRREHYLLNRSHRFLCQTRLINGKATFWCISCGMRVCHCDSLDAETSMCVCWSVVCCVRCAMANIYELAVIKCSELRYG